MSHKKLHLEGGIAEFYRMVESNGFLWLPLQKQYIDIITSLPFIHKDPFDRLIIATAQYEKMSLITADSNIHQYDVDWVWC